MTISVYNGSNWEDVPTLQVYHSGSWRDVQSVEVYNGVEWKECYAAFSMLPDNSMGIGGTISHNPGGTSIVGLRWYLGNPSYPATFNSMYDNVHNAGNNWCDSPGDYTGGYECRYVKSSGDSFNAGNSVDGTWYSMNSTVRTWYLQADASYGEALNITGDIEIRKEGTTSPVMKQGVSFGAKNVSSWAILNPGSMNPSPSDEGNKEAYVVIRGTGVISIVESVNGSKEVDYAYFLTNGASPLTQEFECRWVYTGNSTHNLSSGTTNTWLTLDTAGGRLFNLVDGTDSEQLCEGNITIRRRGDTSDSVTFKVTLETTDY